MLSAILSVIAFASAASAAPHAHAHVDSMARQLPSRWFHDDDHPVHALFRRDASGTPSFPTVGSPQWSAGFPKTASTQVPAAWTNALNAAVQAGTIPNIPVSTQSSPGANPSYGSLSPGKLPVCSSYAQCRLPGQIWDAPNNTIGISFDDGPLPPSDGLYTFLQQNNIPSTHFYIGTNILGQPKEFLFAFETLQSDIAVHTWTHPYMTTLSNAGVVAELGWTIQLIYNSTGGRLPRYWRPPYGDSDARVTAIAKEVFGLTTVIWNKDTADWSLGESSGTTQPAINSNFDKWLSGPKSPGLIILEHELMTSTVQAFMTNYPKFAQHGWQLESVAQLQGAAYQNAESSDSSVNPVGNVLAGGGNGTTLLLPTSSSAAPVSTVQAASGSASPSASPISASGQTSGALHKTRSVPLAVFFALAAFFGGA